MPRQSTVSHVLRMTLLFIAYHAEDINRFSESQIKSYDATIIRTLGRANSKCNVATAKDTADVASLAISEFQGTTYFGDIENPRENRMRSAGSPTSNDDRSMMFKAKSTTAIQKDGQRYRKNGETKVVVEDTSEHDQYPIFLWCCEWTKRQRVQQIPLDENSPPSMTEEVIEVLNGSFPIALIPNANSELSKNSWTMTTTTTQQRKIDSAQDEISGQTGFETINQNDFISNASMWYPTYREIIVENTTNISDGDSSQTNLSGILISKMRTVLRKKRETTSAKGNIAIEEISGREENLSNDTTDNNEDPAITDAILNLGGSETTIDIYVVGLPWRSNETPLDINEKTTLAPLIENYGQVDDTVTFKQIIDSNEMPVVNISMLPDVVKETVPSLIWNDYKLMIIINAEYTSRLSELESRLSKLEKEEEEEEKEEAVECDQCTSTLSTVLLSINETQDNRSSVLKKQHVDERFYGTSPSDNRHSTIVQELKENLTSQSSNLENTRSMWNSEKHHMGKSIGEQYDWSEDKRNVSRMREQTQNGNIEKSNDLPEIFPFSDWRFVNLYPAVATTAAAAAAVTGDPRRTSILDNIPKAAVANTSYRNFVEPRNEIGHHARTYDRYRIVDKPNGRFMNTGAPNDRTAFPTSNVARYDKNAEWPASRMSLPSEMIASSRLSLPSKKWPFQVLAIEGFDLFVPANGVDKDHRMYPPKFWWNLMFPMDSSNIERSDLNIDDSLSSIRSNLHGKDTSDSKANSDKSLSRDLEQVSLLRQRLFSVPSTREPVKNDDRN